MTEHAIGTRQEWRAAVEQDYRFQTDDGTKTLVELFDGRPQLLVHHFSRTGTGWAGASRGFRPRKATSTPTSPSSPTKAAGPAPASTSARKNTPRRSTCGARSSTASAPSRSRGGVVHHTYTCYDRGTDALNATWQLLDRTPDGRGNAPEGWPRPHDEYE